jgi:hypothetical protein
MKTKQFLDKMDKKVSKYMDRISKECDEFFDGAEEALPAILLMYQSARLQKRKLAMEEESMVALVCVKIDEKLVEDEDK